MKEELKCNDGQFTKKEIPRCPTCDKTNHPAERCCEGTGAHLKPKNLKLEDNKSGTSQVGAISKAQKAQNIFFREKT